MDCYFHRRRLPRLRSNFPDAEPLPAVLLVHPDAARHFAHLGEESPSVDLEMGQTEARNLNLNPHPNPYSHGSPQPPTVRVDPQPTLLSERLVKLIRDPENNAHAGKSENDARGHKDTAGSQ